MCQLPDGTWKLIHLPYFWTQSQRDTDTDTDVITDTGTGTDTDIAAWREQVLNKITLKNCKLNMSANKTQTQHRWKNQQHLTRSHDTQVIHKSHSAAISAQH